MTNGELIEALKGFDPAAKAEIAVRCDTKRFPIAFVEPFYNGSNRILVSLPVGMYTVQRKA